jgi:hypothetical protein
MKNSKLIKIASAIVLTMALVLNFSLVANAALNCDNLTTESACASVAGCKWSTPGVTTGTCAVSGATGLSDSIAISEANATDSGLATSTSVPTMVGNVIRIILGISGTAALIIVVMGGVKWMTSGGAEAKITSARKLMVSGAVGIVIIAAAYAITSFVMNQMLAVVG